MDGGNRPSVALLFYKCRSLTRWPRWFYGFLPGLWLIAWIIIAAVFVYKISVKTGGGLTSFARLVFSITLTSVCKC